MIVLRRGVEELPVRLTDDEKMRAGVELAEARQGIARAKAEVKRLTSRLDELTDRITGYAREPVKVEDRIEGEFVVTIRMDNHEVVRERRASEKELAQRELPLSGDVVGKTPFLSSEEIAKEAEQSIAPPEPEKAYPESGLVPEDDGDITAHGITVPDPPVREPWDGDVPEEPEA